jgi:hypothetical protein
LENIEERGGSASVLAVSGVGVNGIESDLGLGSNNKYS